MNRSGTWLSLGFGTLLATACAPAEPAETPQLRVNQSGSAQRLAMSEQLGRDDGEQQEGASEDANANAASDARGGSAAAPTEYPRAPQPASSSRRIRFQRAGDASPAAAQQKPREPDEALGKSVRQRDFPRRE